MLSRRGSLRVGRRQHLRGSRSQLAGPRVARTSGIGIQTRLGWFGSPGNRKPRSARISSGCQSCLPRERPRRLRPRPSGQRARGSAASRRSGGLFRGPFPECIPVPRRPGYGSRARRAPWHVAISSDQDRHSQQVRPRCRSPALQDRPWGSPCMPRPCRPWSARRERTSERYQWTSSSRKGRCGHAVPCRT